MHGTLTGDAVERQTWVTSHEREGVPVLVAVGEFDLATVHLLRDALLDALKESSRVVVDLRGTDYMDSTGLGALIAAYRQAAAHGWVRLVGPQPTVRRIFEMTTLDTVFAIYETVYEALNAGA